MEEKIATLNLSQKEIVSALVYGLALSVLLISQSPIAFPGWVSVPSVIVFAVVAFVVDLTYISKKL